MYFIIVTLLILGPGFIVGSYPPGEISQECQPRSPCKEGEVVTPIIPPIRTCADLFEGTNNKSSPNKEQNCYCKEGYVRLFLEGPCVPISVCETICSPIEYIPNYVPGLVTCREFIKNRGVNKKKNFHNEVNYQCYCKKGYYRTIQGKCVSGRLCLMDPCEFEGDLDIGIIDFQQDHPHQFHHDENHTDNHGNGGFDEKPKIISSSIKPEVVSIKKSETSQQKSNGGDNKVVTNQNTGLINLTPNIDAHHVNTLEKTINLLAFDNSDQGGSSCSNCVADKAEPEKSANATESNIDQGKNANATESNIDQGKSANATELNKDGKEEAPVGSGLLPSAPPSLPGPLNNALPTAPNGTNSDSLPPLPVPVAESKKIPVISKTLGSVLPIPVLGNLLPFPG